MICARPGCLVEFAPKRSQVFCSAACRSQAHRERVESGMVARVKSVRILASGKASVTLHVDSAAHLRPGAEVAVFEKQVA